MEFHKFANIFPLIEGQEFENLVEDIRKNGLQQHTIYLYEGKILDGRNRYRACKQLKMLYDTNVFNFVGTPEEALKLVISLNLHRRHLQESQRSMVGARVKHIYEAEAKERQIEAGKQYGEKHPQEVMVNLPQPLKQKGTARDKAGEAMNVSGSLVHRAEKVIAQGTPELVQAVESGEIAVSAAVAIVNEPPELQNEVVERIHSEEVKTVKQAVRQINKENKKEPPPIKGKYRVIYADPPWEYGNSGIIGNDNYGHAERHYPSMSIQELCKMGEKIKEITEKNAVLFMWVTSPLLEECFPVIKSWGFKYKSSFVWDKIGHNYGHYNSVRHEFLLICTKGSCVPDYEKKLDSVISIQKTRKHSEKPAEFRQLIDQLCITGNRIELFSREKVENWEAWGNEPG